MTIDKMGKDMIQYEVQKAIQGTPQGETVLKDSLEATPTFVRKDLSSRHSQKANRGLGEPTCKPTGFSRGYLTGVPAMGDDAADHQANRRREWFFQQRRARAARDDSDNLGKDKPSTDKGGGNKKEAQG